MQCVVGGDFYIRKVNELMDFLLLLSNGEMGEMGNILYDMEIDDQLGWAWQSGISRGMSDKMHKLLCSYPILALLLSILHRNDILYETALVVQEKYNKV